MLYKHLDGYPARIVSPTRWTGSEVEEDDAGVYADCACGMYQDMERFAACSIAPGSLFIEHSNGQKQKTDRLKSHDV